MRETGYYWVKGTFGDWAIGYYDEMEGCWRLVNDIHSWFDFEFMQIDERKIERKE